MTALKKTRRTRRAFYILVAVVIISGLALWSHGDLRSPVQSTAMLIDLSSSDAGFAMAGERGAPPDMAASSETSSSVAAAPEAEAANTATTDTTATTTAMTTGTMTLETLTAELAAAGVDVETLSTTMAAEGRSLENLLSVVNSGRVTVAELAARLNGESTESSPQQPAEGSTSLLDIRWEEIGSVAYNLWFMLAATVAVIVVARPVGWLVNRVKRPQTAAT